MRKAVGAVIFQGDKYLLVHKVKSMEGSDSPVNITGTWDFPKGGVKETDKDLEKAILRELKEETGSGNYKLINRFDKKICFEFPKSHKYARQETVMFYMEYLGDGSDLFPQDEEIDEVRFYSRDEVINILCLEETLKFLDEVRW